MVEGGLKVEGGGLEVKFYFFVHLFTLFSLKEFGQGYVRPGPKVL